MNRSYMHRQRWAVGKATEVVAGRAIESMVVGTQEQRRLEVLSLSFLLAEAAP